MEDDGYYLPEIRPHSLEKIRRHDFYADVFTKAMHRKYRHRPLAQAAIAQRRTTMRSGS